jgi:asparagine synthase (glutamine-hydrolysing)
MCGINGIIYHDNSKRVDTNLIQKMNDQMIFRGPDDEGVFYDGNFGCGMRRLSIIGVTNGHQPILNEDKNLVLVFNGEIYNYIELKAKLENLGHVFSTNSDAEVVLHLFEEKGEDCILDLVGMFSFSIWNKNKRELFIARDQFGVKPLYYYNNEDYFIYSSSVFSIMEIMDDLKIDTNSFFNYLVYSYTPRDSVMISGVKKLLPAHFLKYDKGNVLLQQYWDIDLENTATPTSESNYQEMFLDKYRKSVVRNLESDVKVGMFLSGGLDSSSILSLIPKNLLSEFNTFTVSFDGGNDESSIAKEVSQKFSTKHSEINLKEGMVKNTLHECMQYLDDPIADNSIIPTYLIAKFAHKKNIKVVLTGAGGDELFGGYTRYFSQNFLVKVLQKLPKQLRGFIGIVYGYFDFDNGMRIKDERYNFIASQSGSGFQSIEKLFKKRHSVDKCVTRMDCYVKNIKNRKELMYFDLKEYLPNDVLALNDKMTMGNSIEARVPLLDVELTEFAYSLPNKILFKEGVLKSFMKRSFFSILPLSVLNQKKTGFSGPVFKWVNGILKEDIFRLLIKSPNSFIKSTLDKQELLRLFDRGQKSKSDSQLLFALYVFSLWYENHFNRYNKDK